MWSGLPTYQIRWKLEKLFVDIRTDVRTDTPEFQSTRSSLGDDLKTENLVIIKCIDSVHFVVGFVL